MKIILITGLCLAVFRLSAQPENCLLFPEATAARRACELYQAGCLEPQGSAPSQALFDQAIAADSTFAAAWYEKSVPFLKRGLWAEWNRLNNVAVRLDPAEYRGKRGWCRYKFLLDARNALPDLLYHDSITSHKPGRTGDGDYDIRMYIGFCYRDLGDSLTAVKVMEQCILENEEISFTGTWDYYHLGVLHFQLGNLAEAEKWLNKQFIAYPELADNLYYLGKIFLIKNQGETAAAYLKRAEQSFLQGYRLCNPYTGFPDEVALQEIRQLLGKTKP